MLELIPIRFDSMNLFDGIAEEIATETNLQIIKVERIFSFEDFYDFNRAQYDASKILKAFELKNNHETKQLILTSLDLFIPIFTYVFGLAKLNGHNAIVSSCRLKNEYYGLPGKESILFPRIVKEIVHEFGHLKGLRHCSNYNCVMASSTSIDELDVKSTKFCNLCSPKIA